MTTSGWLKKRQPPSLLASTALGAIEAFLSQCRNGGARGLQIRIATVLVTLHQVMRHGPVTFQLGSKWPWITAARSAVLPHIWLSRGASERFNVAWLPESSLLLQRAM